VPIYRSWLCYNEKFTQGWWGLGGEKSGYKSFIVQGYVNKATLHIEYEGWAHIIRVYIDDKKIFERANYAGNVGNQVIDITQYFKPRRTEDGEQATKYTIKLVDLYAFWEVSWKVTAYIDIDVTGTITETSSYTESGFGGIESITGVFVQLMFMMMVMNLLMSMMSMFMGVFL
jgi:hypothetical protein